MSRSDEARPRRGGLLRLFRWVVGLALVAVLPVGCVDLEPGSGRFDPNATHATIEVLDVGQGDAILIRSPEQHTVLVDAGPSDEVASLLAARGVGAIDVVVISHHHRDHYGGLDAVLDAHPVTYLVDSGSPLTSPSYNDVLEQVARSGIRVIRPWSEQPRRIQVGSLHLTLLPQPPTDDDEENNNSVGLRVDHQNVSILLTGDSEDAERSWWMKRCPELVADCQILKLAHHGSHNGTDPDWLALVRPEYAVVSCGIDNAFGHPHRETLELLASARIPLARTDRQGTIRILSDGLRYTFPNGRGSAATDSRLDINRATLDDLVALPGIGETLARRILERRPYRSLDELDDVPGIGAERLNDLRRYLVVRP